MVEKISGASHKTRQGQKTCRGGRKNSCDDWKINHMVKNISRVYQKISHGGQKISLVEQKISRVDQKVSRGGRKFSHGEKKTSRGMVEKLFATWSKK